MLHSTYITYRKIIAVALRKHAYANGLVAETSMIFHCTQKANICYIFQADTLQYFTTDIVFPAYFLDEIRYYVDG